MLGLRVCQILIRVDQRIIAGDKRIDIDKHQQHRQKRQQHDIALFPEKHPSHAAPVGIPGRVDLLRCHRVIRGEGKQLFLRQSQRAHIFHLLTSKFQFTELFQILRNLN